jgi:hypothetical protein
MEPAMTSSADLRKFLSQALPPQSRNNVDGIVRALEEAGRRYERYAAKRSEWNNYAKRLARLKKILTDAEKLQSELTALDPITKDEIGKTLGDEEVEKLQGHLSRLTGKKADLTETIQNDGRPRDLATRIWVLELAEIYKNNFGRKATISGSGDGNSSTRGTFFELLKISQPDSFPRYGALHPKKLTSILQTR